jgi:DNA-binding MarR family transcriptional regulator
MPAAALPLELLLGLNRTYAVVSRRFDADLGALHGLGLNDLHVLVTLDQAPERRLRRVDLARALGITPSGVTWLLRPLSKRRLVSSQPSPDDARVAFAVLTPAGQQLVANAVPTARHLAAAMLEGHRVGTDLAQVASFVARLGS